MNEGYILEWLDTLVTVTLNPVKTKVTSIHPDDIQKLQSHINNEKGRIIITIKTMVFSVVNEDHIRSGIKKYHSSLIDLLDQAMENQIHNSKYPGLEQISNELVLCIDELLLLIEGRFANYLGTYERLPTTYFLLVKKELVTRITAIADKFENYPALQPVAGMIGQALVNRLNHSTGKRPFTFQETAYIKDLCSEVERLDIKDNSNIFSVLDELLIYWNFNSRVYIDNLTQRLAKSVNNHIKPEERMEQLLFCFKSFKQLHRKPDVVFNPKQMDLHKAIGNWFRHEIFFLERKMRLSVTPLKSYPEMPRQKVFTGKPKQKVTCTLSTDQTGLILRAADELRILVAKSMSEVFKSIVPHLSTPYKENLSYDGMRSKSYVAEDRDKQIAIETLQRIIKKIEEY